MTIEREQVNQENGQPRSGGPEDLEADQIDRDDEQDPGDRGGHLGGHLPVAGLVASDQAMHGRDRHRIDWMVDRTDQSLPPRALIDCPGLGDVAEAVGEEDVRVGRQPPQERGGGDDQEPESPHMRICRHSSHSFALVPGRADRAFGMKMAAAFGPPRSRG